MALHGSICFFYEILIEWHNSFVSKEVSKSLHDFLKFLRKPPKHDIRNCRFHIDDLDNESYGDGADMKPFLIPTNPSSETSHVTSSSKVLRRKMMKTITEEWTGSMGSPQMSIINKERSRNF
jgi:hypothetical protein